MLRGKRIIAGALLGLTTSVGVALNDLDGSESAFYSIIALTTATANATVEGRELQSCLLTIVKPTTDKNMVYYLKGLVGWG